MTAHDSNLVEVKTKGDRLLAAGRLHDAEQVYRQILAMQDDAAEVWLKLGVVLSQLGRNQESLDSFQQAASLQPKNPDAPIHISRLLLSQGNLDKAAAHLQTVLKARPRHLEANLLMGSVHMRNGRMNQAAMHFNRVLAMSPRHVEALFNLGQIHRSIGNHSECAGYLVRAFKISPGNLVVLDHLARTFGSMGAWVDAESCWRKYLSLSGDGIQAHMGLGIALYQRDKLDRAARCFQHVLALQPDNIDALNNLGIIHKQKSEWKKAEHCFSRIVKLNGGHINAIRSLANICQLQGRHEAAVKYYHQLLEVAPGDAQALNSLGVIAQKKTDYIKAEQYFRQAIASDDLMTGVYTNLGNNLHIQGKFDEARRCYEHVHRSGEFPGVEVCLATLLPVIYNDSTDIKRHRRRVEQNVGKLLKSPPKDENPLRLYSPSQFFYAYQGLNDCGLMKKLAKLSLAACPSLGYQSPHCKEYLKVEEKEKLSIAFISGHFTNHTISRLTRGLIAHLSRERFHVTVVMVGGGSDKVTDEILQTADDRMILTSNFFQSRKALSERKFDIIFYPDLGMMESTYYLSFARLAPLQCVTWGHPVTTGIANVDYFISCEDIEPDGAESHYSEQLVKLNHLPVYYQQPVLHADYPNRCRSDFGLADERNLYLCPQTLFKFHPDFDPILAGILRGDPDGDIVLINQTDHYRNLLQHRWAKTMPDVADRIRFLPRQHRGDFLWLLRLCDVMLDTIHFGGGNTNFEVFAMGTPVVTLPGQFMRSRVAYACYRKMGIDDCIVSSPEEYIQIANRLGCDKAFRAAVSDRIMSCNGVLYENEAAILELEDFLVNAYNRSCERLTRNHQHTIKLDSDSNASVSLNIDKKITVQRKTPTDVLHDVSDLIKQGVDCAQRSELDKAAEHFSEAINLDPTCQLGYYNLGMIFKLKGKFQDAESTLKNALSINPEDVGSLRELGEMLHCQGRLVEAEDNYLQALKHRRTDPQLLRALGMIARDQSQFDKAYDYFRRAIELDDRKLESLIELANVEQMRGNTESSQRYYEQAMHQNNRPELALRIAMLTPVIYRDKKELQYWRNRLTGGIRHMLDTSIQVEHPWPLYSPSHFFLSYQGYNDRELMSELAGLALSSCPRLSYTAEHCQGTSNHPGNGKLSVAFISRHFNNHAITKLTKGYIQHLSRDLFNVTVVFAGTRKDQVSTELAKLCDDSLDLPNHFDRARTLLAGKRYDIIFYPDLGMTANTYFLSLARLAPLQCATWGHPNTSGVPTIDCYLSSGLIEPEDAQQHYTEQLVKMEHLPAYYFRPRIRTSHRQASRSSFRLDDSKHIYLCPQSLFKLHPDYDQILSAILREDPAALIVFIEQVGCHINLLKSRWEVSLSGIDWQDRILFLPEQTEHGFYSLINISDVVLDTIHFGGGNTHYESFAIGTPVVTLPGRFMRSRVACGCYQRMGIADCVAYDAEDYVRIALRLARDGEFRETIHQRILERNDLLFENMESVRELEQVLITAHRRIVKAGIRT